MTAGKSASSSRSRRSARSCRSPSTATASAPSSSLPASIVRTARSSGSIRWAAHSRSSSTISPRALSARVDEQRLQQPMPAQRPLDGVGHGPIASRADVERFTHALSPRAAVPVALEDAGEHGPSFFSELQRNRPLLAEPAQAVDKPILRRGAGQERLQPFVHWTPCPKGHQQRERDPVFEQSHPGPIDRLEEIDLAPGIGYAGEPCPLVPRAEADQLVQRAEWPEVAPVLHEMPEGIPRTLFPQEQPQIVDDAAG